MAARNASVSFWAASRAATSVAPERSGSFSIALALRETHKSGLPERAATAICSADAFLPGACK